MLPLVIGLVLFKGFFKGLPSLFKAFLRAVLRVTILFKGRFMGFLRGSSFALLVEQKARDEGRATLKCGARLYKPGGICKFINKCYPFSPPVRLCDH